MAMTSLERRLQARHWKPIFWEPEIIFWKADTSTMKPSCETSENDFGCAKIILWDFMGTGLHVEIDFGPGLFGEWEKASLDCVWAEQGLNL